VADTHPTESFFKCLNQQAEKAGYILHDQRVDGVPDVVNGENFILWEDLYHYRICGIEFIEYRRSTQTGYNWGSR